MNAARDGILTFMVGGEESRFEQCKSILDNMGKNVVYCGGVGTGEVSYEKLGLGNIPQYFTRPRGLVGKDLLAPILFLGLDHTSSSYKIRRASSPNSRP